MLWLYSWAVALRPSPRTIWLSLVPLLVVGAGAAVNIAGGTPIVATLVAFILQSIVLHAAARALWRRRVRSDVEQIVAREIHWVRRHSGGFTGTITIDVRPSGQIEVERRARQQELGHGSGNVPVQRADSPSVVAVSPPRTGEALTRVILAAVILGVTGCGAAALYQNPTTGQTQLCQQDTNALMLWGFDTGYTACKDALERAGWKRL